MSSPKLLLDYVYEHEAARPDAVYMTQPIGGGAVLDYTWGQTLDQARRMAAHIKSLNIEPGARIAILSKNCAHFIMAELAIWMAGCSTVAIFPTETAQTVAYVLEHSEASLLFVGKLDTWEQQQPGLPAGLHCIAFPLAPRNGFDTWDKVVARTEPLKGKPGRAPTDTSMLMYTSGSTGQPKGVTHNFERITRASEGIVGELHRYLDQTTELRVLSYLPLAHVFERSWVSCSGMVLGKGRMYFAESLETFVQDLNRARPTYFISVPRLWLKFQQGVFTKMPPKKLDFLLSLPLIGGIVRRKVLKGLGLDQVVMAGSGSAPIPAELIDWYRRLGLNLLEGYAMTEDFAYSCGSNPEHNAPGCVGVALPGVQIRLSEEGEVLVKSPGQMVGYYKRPDLDAQSFTPDGFFRTGDKGELHANGLLKLSGRVKEIFKTSKGKYVAPAPIENRINAHPMVETSMVSGVGQSAAYAMVVLAESLRPQLNEAAVRDRVQSELAELLQQVNQSVAEYERLQMIVVTQQPWSIENGMLTPTMKIRRSQIEASVEAQLPNWYASQARVQWH